MLEKDKESSRTPRSIYESVLINKQYIFSSFNDQRIWEVEEMLRQLGTDFVTTSQEGNDYVIGIEGSSFYRKFYGDGINGKDKRYHEELLEEVKEDLNSGFLELSNHVALTSYTNLKKVHSGLVKFLEKGPTKGMTSYAEAFDKFYGSGCGPGASLVEELMESEGVTL